jgi:flagellin
MKNSSDTENYNREFKDLQMQVYDMAALKFNGVSLFATTTTRNGSINAVFDNLNQVLTKDNTVSVFVSAEGNTGPIVSVSKSLLLSALTINTSTLATGTAYDNTLNASYTGSGGNVAMTFGAEDSTKTINLSDISVGVFTQAIQNVASLRADNGASMSRLRFAGDEMALQKTNLQAANGRIIDVDIAEESTRLAKYNVLVQASASMLAQANASTDVALMLLR